MKKSDPPVTVVHVFDRPTKDVWKAITNHDEMIQWFFANMPDFKPEVGFKTQFNVKAPSRDFLHQWEVVEVIPERKIVVNWKYEDISGDSFVTMALEPLNDKTKFTVSTNVIEDFDDSIPEFKRESCEAGWNYFIKEQLANHLKN